MILVYSFSLFPELFVTLYDNLLSDIHVLCYKVWCDTGYPRLVKRPLDSAITGKVSQRCACFKEEELDRPGLEVYKGCDFLSKTCPV